MGEKWTEMLFMKMVSAAPRSEEEDRELVPRGRGLLALESRLLRRRQVAFVDASFEVETLDAVRRDEAEPGVTWSKCAVHGRSALRRIGEHSMWMICGAPSTGCTYIYI